MTADAIANSLEDQFGGIDIYLFDQLLRGRLNASDRVLDAGCGWGRNLVYLMQAGIEVFGVDADADAIAEVRSMARRLAPALPAENFRAEPLERMTFPAGAATVVICSAVLHFARDDDQFDAMLGAAWRALAPGGMWFSRLASSIGIENRVQPRSPGSRYCRLPDGTERFLVDEPLLMRLTERLGGQLLDPIKTTVVQDQRSMTTWVVRKRTQAR